MYHLVLVSRHNRSLKRHCFVFSMTDPYCDANYFCEERLLSNQVCPEFTKGVNDVFCHLPCEVNNCTVTLIQEDYCYIWDCISLASTTTTTTSSSSTSTSLPPDITTSSPGPVPPQPDDYLGVKIGVPLAALCLLVVAIVIVIKIRRRRVNGYDDIEERERRAAEGIQGLFCCNPFADQRPIIRLDVLNQQAHYHNSGEEETSC